jgi:anti-anti-sigma regulatory factor
VNTAVALPVTVRLPMRATLRECMALKQQLLGLVESAESVTIDVTDVELIDTAALQLLFAFGRERIAKGLSTCWQGDSPTVRTAATTMGLDMGDSAGSDTSSVCNNVS